MIKDAIWKLLGLFGITPEATIEVRNPNYVPQPTATPTSTQPPRAQQYAPQQTKTRTASYGKPARNPNVENFTIQDSVVSAINNAAQQYGVPPELLFDIALQESGFNPQTKNQQPGSTASGLFQFTKGTLDTAQNYANMPGSTLDWPENPDVFDPNFNANLAAYLISKGQLSRWNASKPIWGNYYSEDELAPYYSQSPR